MSEYYNKNDLFLEPKTTQYGSHMVMTNVHKPKKTKYVNIDTRYSDTYDYLESSNYNITLPERINEVKTMTIKSVELPMTFYNISAALGNNYFKLTDYNSDAVPVRMITVPDGNYTMESLKNTLNGLFDSIYSGNISPNDADIRYYYGSNFSFFYTNSARYLIEFDVDSKGGKDKYNLKSKLGWLLGFRKPTYNLRFDYSDNPPAGTGPDGQPLLKSEGFIDLNSPKYLYLAIEEFNKGNQNSFVSPVSNSLVNKNIIAKIIIDNTTYPFNSVLPANNLNGLLLSDVRNYTGKIDLLKLNVQLLSEYGNVMSLNGIDFSFCLEIEHE